MIELSDGSSLEADIVVMAVGARPVVDLAREAGITIGPRGGIAVDAHMRTRRLISSRLATPWRPLIF